MFSLLEKPKKWKKCDFLIKLFASVIAKVHQISHISKIGEIFK